MPFPTEYQRRHFGHMEMQRRAEMFTGHPMGRIAVALAVAWQYRHRAMAPMAGAGDRKFWLGLARSAVSRAREDRTVTQPAQARFRTAITTVANDCADKTATMVTDMRLFADATTGRMLEEADG